VDSILFARRQEILLHRIGSDLPGNLEN